MQLLPKPEHNGHTNSHTNGHTKSNGNGKSHKLEPLITPLDPKTIATEAITLPNWSSTIDRGRLVVLIDGSNLFYAALNLGIEIDYTKLLTCLATGGRLIRAYFYTGVDSANDKQQGFLLWMRRNGYRVVSKELVQFPDGSKKASLEVKIAVDMMTLASHCDTMILLSGDGDLSYAVENVTYRGTRVEVISLRSMSSESLINVADSFIDLETIKHHIQKS